jgi:uncharacterized damage-inducible protein DinB
MITKDKLAESYAVNLRLIQMQTDGLSHADSLIQTQFNINSLNWVVGHIAVNRDNVLKLLDEEPLLTEAQTARYRRESEPIVGDGVDVIRLEKLLELLERGQEIISKTIAGLSEDDLAREIQVGENMVTLGTRLFGYYFHDTYHTGQTDLLRQVAGTDDKVI